MTRRPRRQTQTTNPPIPGDGISYEHIGVIDPVHLRQHPHEACAARQIVLRRQAMVFRLLLLGRSSAAPSSPPLHHHCLRPWSYPPPPLPMVLPIYPQQTIQNMGCLHGLDASSPPQTFCTARGGGGAVEAEGGRYYLPLQMRGEVADWDDISVGVGSGLRR